ncbi:MAG: NDP-sugar synthase [Suipraeoptans sp.]
MSKNCTLVIMAAGIGSRYKGGIKQLESVGPNGELIIDYSINDAIRAGFTTIAFIIREEISDVFKEVIGNRIEAKIKVQYIYQEKNKVPVKFNHYIDGRKKPWGTGHAVLQCKGVVNEPFCIINADDYYGPDAFIKMYEYLENTPESLIGECALLGYFLKNTLSESGGVTRGICNVGLDGYMENLLETKNVRCENGNIVSGPEDNLITYDENTLVSMNMWAFNKEFLNMLEVKFDKFLSELKDEPETKEFLVPIVVDELLKDNILKVKVLNTNEKWYGITYQEDLPLIREKLKNKSER